MNNENNMAIHLRTLTEYASIRFYLITHDPETHSYMMVLQYGQDGNLREYLKNNFNNINWERKLDNLQELSGRVLSGDEEYTKAADVYSFGTISYEIVAGFPPYPNIPHDKALAMKICNGLRPNIPFHIPKLITRMIIRCWDARVTHRPTFKELHEICGNTIVIVVQIKLSKNLGLINSTTTTPLNYQTHPQAIYISRLLNFSKLPKPKNEEI
ncbi:hypothetical protein Glove_815540g2 [Diversispora epigaea]|uniref:Protein kinase domain-containing protein n=1 Tax=Diversispora epigaea TaxID=1348612 RepID=A0A397FXI6_9GLOM|nr:hypothetical protein Glove_815540g2 [Diversispora epigaea]